MVRIWIAGALLAAVGLNLGASLEEGGVQQARRWQRTADVARAVRQWDAAFVYYLRVAEAFPGTPHGRLANVRAEEARKYLLSPEQASADETPDSWVLELFDFITWP